MREKNEETKTLALIGYLREHLALLGQSERATMRIHGDEVELTTRFGSDGGNRFVAPCRQYIDMASLLDVDRYSTEEILAHAAQILDGGDLAAIYHPHVLERARPILQQVRDLIRSANRPAVRLVA